MEWFFKLYMLSYLLITIGATMQDNVVLLFMISLSTNYGMLVSGILLD